MGKEDIEILKSEKDLTWAYEYGVKFYEKFDVSSPLNDGDIISLENIRDKVPFHTGIYPGGSKLFFRYERRRKYLQDRYSWGSRTKYPFR